MKTKLLRTLLPCLFFSLSCFSWTVQARDGIPMHDGIAPIDGIAPACSTQSKESQEESFLRRIEQIKTEPLELLPASDCRLDQLEEEIFKTYYTQGQEIPLQLKVHLQRKRQQMDFMRSHIDSLYYMQALQAIGQEEPDWDEAMESIEKSLLHNRFYTRSVIFKMHYLLKRERNAETCLRYLNTTFQEFSRPEKLRKTAQTTYNTLLQQAERMIDNRQYRDALSLCELIHIYCQPGFPIQYLSYREDLIENRSHQGIYDSYCEVAQKAFRQTQYQLAGQYALLAHQYYTENETHMSGINQALELLDRISDCYYRFAQESDTTERAYYMALIDSIAHKTGIPLYLEEDYDPAQDIAADLQLLDPGTKPESIAVPAFVPLNIDSILPDGKPLNSRQAQQYFDQAYEQANYFRSKRDFAEAQRWFELAKKLKEKHGYLRTGPDFSERYRQNLLQSMEQMLNKAVYYLWTTEIAQSEELQQQALELFASYQIEEPEDATTLTKLQLMLDNYQKQRNANYCEQIGREFTQAEHAFLNQASYGNYQLAKKSLESLRQVARKYSLPEYASCSLPEKQMRKAENLFERWTAYNDSLNQAEAYLAAGDTLRFIQCYLNADSTFNRIGLAEYIPSAPSLFSRLSATRQFSILLLWAKNCVEQGDLDQARFIAGYLSAIGYSRPDIEKTQRTLKKKQGQEKRGGRP